jgi:hypothetical protein
MEPWRVCRPVIANSHHFDESRIRIIIKVKSQIRVGIKMKIEIRIRIKVMRVRNPAWCLFYLSHTKDCLCGFPV